MPKETPSQTAGPYVHIGCVPNFAGLTGVFPEDLGSRLTAQAIGMPIRLEGRIFDGDGNVVRDAMIELCQLDGSGKLAIWLRQPVDLETGYYRFDTVKPAQLNAAPHVNLWIVARGINLGLNTRAYFPDEDNKADALLQLAGSRRTTLVAKRPDAEEDERDFGCPVYRFDIHLQGEEETVFLDV